MQKIQSAVIPSLKNRANDQLGLVISEGSITSVPFVKIIASFQDIVSVKSNGSFPSWCYLFCITAKNKTPRQPPLPSLDPTRPSLSASHPMTPSNFQASLHTVSRSTLQIPMACGHISKYLQMPICTLPIKQYFNISWHILYL